MRNRKALLSLGMLLLFCIMPTPAFSAWTLTAPTATVKPGEMVTIQGRVKAGRLIFSWYGDVTLVPDPANMERTQALLKDAETQGVAVIIQGTAQSWSPGVSGRVVVKMVDLGAVPDQWIRLIGKVTSTRARYELSDPRYGTVRLTTADLSLQESLSRAVATQDAISVLGAPQVWTSLKEVVVKQVGADGNRQYDPRLSVYGLVEVIPDGYQLLTPAGKRWRLTSSDPWFRATLAKAAAEKTGLDVWGVYHENGNDIQVTQVALSGSAYVGPKSVPNPASPSAVAPATPSGSSQAAKPTPSAPAVAPPGSVAAPRASQESVRQQLGTGTMPGTPTPQGPSPVRSTGSATSLIEVLGVVAAVALVASVLTRVRRSFWSFLLGYNRGPRRGAYRRTLDVPPQELQKAMNSGELILYDHLEQIAAGRPVLIAPKMRLADVIHIDGVRLDTRTRKYAFMAHLDFVLIDLRTQAPLCGVELDGRQHAMDPATMERDRMKEALCEAGSLPLIRIRFGEWHLLEEVRRLLPGVSLTKNR